MKLKSTGYVLAFAVIAGLVFISACTKSEHPVNPVIATTPLYDTLGWFAMGGSGNVIKGQGIKMVSDPDNKGKQIQAGRLAIRTVVNEALMVIAGDTRLSKYFPTLLSEVNDGNTTGFAALLNSFTDFVQQGVSGQKVYHGKSMKEAHKHATYKRFGSHEVSTVADKADFDIFVGDIAQAAQTLKVPNSVIAQLGALLNSTKGDVVQ